jgi:hypothetical protein
MEAPKMTDEDKNDPTVWFVVLERGRQTADAELIARAKQELERLGVTVKYTRPAEREALGASDAK